jgi:hypothetical protein
VDGATGLATAAAPAGGGGGEGEAPLWERAAFPAGAEAPLRALRPNGARALFSALGVETILVWTALMLRRRVAVLGPTLPDVSRAVRLCSLLVAHRFPVSAGGAAPAGAPAGVGTSGAAGIWDGRFEGSPALLQWPYCVLSDAPFAGRAGASGAAAAAAAEAAVAGAPAPPRCLDDCAFDGALGSAAREAIAEAAAATLADLEGAPAGVVAGFTDGAVAARGGEVWDVLVDLSARTITVAEGAKGAPRGV